MEQEKRWIHSADLFFAIEELLAEGRQAVFTVTGMSMWPFLCHGRDQVVIEACDPGKIKKGDVVLIRTILGNYLLHRVTRVEKDGFITTGDGNCFRDGKFPHSCLRAKAVFMIRKGKKIDCTSGKWKLIFRVWMELFPVRRFLLWGLRKISNIKNKLKYKK